MVPKLQIFAHRGASHDAPENTLAALRLGFAHGADAGECDLRLTLDGHAVLMHDACTARTTGMERVVRASTLEQLRRLDAGAWKGALWMGERMPTLAEALGAVPTGRRLLLELKCGVEILPAIAHAFAAAGRGTEAWVLMSFDRAVTREAKRLFPAVEVHQLHEWPGAEPGRGEGAAGLVAAALVDGLDGLNLDKYFPIDAAFVATVHAARLKLCVWTVDDAGCARRLAAAGVDAITTNRPGWLREQLAGEGPG